MKDINNMSAFKLRNFIVFVGFLTIVLVLSIAYIAEYCVGRRTLSYVSVYLTVLILMSVAYVVLFLMFCETERLYAYLTLFIYFAFHIFTMATSPYAITFCYIFPMMFLYGMYRNNALNVVITGGTVITFTIAYAYKGITGQPVNATEFEIVVACLLLDAVFMSFSQVPVIKNIKRIDELEQELLSDALTRCWNRKFLDNLIRLGFFKDKRTSVIIGDINDFKSINDNYGHIQGDAVLMRIGYQLKRICDLYEDTWEVRIGGDEFAVVTKRENPAGLLQELVYACNTDAELLRMDMNVSIAFGLSCNTNDIKTYQQLYEEADVDMYNRKESMKVTSC